MDYFLYWGKARSKGEGPSCHLLPFHCLDVAAVGWCLLGPQRPLTQQLAVQLGLPVDSLRKLLVWALGLHDLGKFARAFQGQAQPAGVELVALLPRLAYSKRHDRLGALLWKENWIPWLQSDALRWPESQVSREQRESLSKAFAALMAPMFGHHGKPVTGVGLNAGNFFGRDETSDDIEAARHFIADWTQLIELEWPSALFTSQGWYSVLESLSWTLAGWAVLSDWIGSNREHFAYHDQPMALSDYWDNVAKPNATHALKAFGFHESAIPIPYAGLQAWFGGRSDIIPTPLQRQAELAELPAGPQLFILEDVTGAGKTEAACILAQRLLASGHGEGLYFALPTMATSNAMYSRLGNLHQHFFSAQSRPSLVLAHGARELNEDFAKALGKAQPGDRNYTADEHSASSQCNHWLADSRKKALLAEVGVGTIDQALMGVLPFRHQSLRLYGLARKVLIVDEVHAYDMYMQELLQQLLTYHARQGGSAMLLTATLPKGMRQSLSDAWCVGLGVESAVMQKSDFPLMTQVCRDGYLEASVASRPEAVRDVEIDWLTQEEQALETVMAALEKGLCVAWVRNTVDDAVRAFEAIRARHPEPSRCLLFHSRFAMADRQRLEAQVLERLGKESSTEVRHGQVLIATQVFQESLDCDVDLMISDLAPIDLLIQRAGRLQRHAREPRLPPRLLVLAPEWSKTPDADWLRRPLPGTQAVYRDTALCWLTQRVLRELGAIRMPGEARALVEGVYGTSVADLPEALIDNRLESKGKQRQDVAMAHFNALALEKGYFADNGQWSEEAEIGTRLVDEPSINIVLLRRDSQGRLALWVDAPRHAGMLSQLKLRESQARKLAPLPEPHQLQWEALKEQEKALRFTQPWLVEVDEGYRYDPSFGLRQEEDGPR
nr:CRISPR-associated helicase Cas3' [uncultured Halomonas sp.]